MLSDKQKRFCDEYLIDFNATQAAIRAGYSKKTAGSQGQRLLKKVEIRNFFATKVKKDEKRLDYSLEKTLTEISRVAFQDVRNFYDENGNLIPVHMLSDDAAAVIAGMEEDEITEWVDGKKLVIGTTKKIKRYDKTKALEMLAKYHKLYSDAPVVNNKISLENLSADELKLLLDLKKKAGA